MQRDSNIELLRLVAMFGIVLLHLLINGSTFLATESSPTMHIIANSIVGFVYVGVNCFILISGYYGVTFRWKSLFSLYLVCFFYELLGLVFAYFYSPDFHLQLSHVGSVIFPLSHSNLWYIRCYVILLFLSPIINPGLQSLNKKQYQNVILLLTILNLYFGWFWKHPDYNSDGYNISQFIYLYVIGGYLHRYCSLEWIRNHRYLFLAGFLGLSIFWGLIQNVHDLVHIVPHWNGWSYSNPVVILSSIGLFLFFVSLSFESKAINNIAKGTLAVYIFHCNQNFEQFLFNQTSQLTLDQSLGVQLCILIVAAISIVVVISMFDIIRITIASPIFRRIPH